MGFVMMLTVPSCTKNTEEPTNHEQAVQKLKESQECCYLEYGVREKVQGKAAKISREAAVVVHVQQPGGRYRGTGTYFKYKGRHIVVTAAHIWGRVGSRAVINRRDGRISSRTSLGARSSTGILMSISQSSPYLLWKAEPLRSLQGIQNMLWAKMLFTLGFPEQTLF